MLTAVIFSISVLYLVYRYALVQRKNLERLPPGPKPLPLLGNIRDFPLGPEPEFRHWLTHKDLYGPISSLNVLGRTIIILHDKDAAHKILAETPVAADRPESEFASKLCGFNRLFFARPYDDEFRRQRRLLHQQIGTRTQVTRSDEIRKLHCQKFLSRTLDNPKGVFDHLERKVGAVTLDITYGYYADEVGTDPLVRLASKAARDTTAASVPGAWLVDALPFLKYLPDGIPGTGFKETARQTRARIDLLLEAPYQFVKRRMATNDHKPSFVSRLLEQNQAASGPSPLELHDIRMTAGMMYLAASDAIHTGLKSLILAMTLFPDVQAQAQAEIDEVVGRGRLPGPEDQANLPYTNALAMEVARWWPAAVMGVPHMLSKDINYNGYYMPEGAIVMPAIWWFTHDPEVYKEPDQFDPNRYLAPRHEPDPALHVFGYGRRKCPGNYMGQADIFLTTVQTLAAFKISKETDEDGNEIEINPNELEGSGIICTIKDFPCQITLRSPEYVDLLKGGVGDQLEEERDSSYLDVATFAAYI